MTDTHFSLELRTKDGRSGVEHNLWKIFEVPLHYFLIYFTETTL